MDSQEEDKNISLIKEFLCEAFCLIDIRNELEALNQGNLEASQQRQSLGVDFGSPSQFISPIAPQRDYNEADTSAQQIKDTLKTPVVHERTDYTHVRSKIDTGGKKKVKKTKKSPVKKSPVKKSPGKKTITTLSLIHI